MGSILKVNQGSKASQEDLYKLVNQIQTVILSQEIGFYSEPIDQEDVVGSQLKQVLADKPYLKKDSPQVLATLNLASSNGISNGGKLDVVKYFNDPDYRKVATDYYNLIKYTFNTLDLLNNLPHFNNMYKAFVEGNAFISNNVQKYKFLGNPLESILEIATKNGEISSFDIMKGTRLMGKATNPVSLSPDAINGANDYVDSMILTQFFKELKFDIDLHALFKELGKTSANLLEYDKMNIKERSYEVQDMPKTIDLATEYGRAQFKYVMEEYIIPHLKSKYKENGFLKAYSFSQHKNYNLKNKISYYMDPSNFAELEKLEIGIAQLIDRSGTGGYVMGIKSMANNTSNIRVMDLLSLYDMITNEGRFGGNRTTALLSKDMDVPGAISKQYADFQLKYGESPDFTVKLQALLEKDPSARGNLFLRMFGKTIRGTRSVSLTQSRGENEGTKIVMNRYFTLPDTTSDSIVNKEVESVAKELLNLTESLFVKWDKNCN